MLPTKCRVKWSFGSGKEGKNRFSRWLPWRPSLGTILAIFDLQVTLVLPSKFGVNLPFGSGEEAKNRFSRWLPWRPSWISHRHSFSYFWSISHPNASYQVWSQLALRFRSRSEKYFQDGSHDGHLGLPIGRILAIFDLQVPLMLPSKFGVNWPFSSGEEAKNRLSRWRPWRPSWISDQHDFSYFWSTNHPDAS